MTLTTRAATVEDAADIARIHVASWQEAYAGLIPADVLAGLSVSTRQAGWIRSLADDRNRATVIADDAAGIIGFAAYGRDRQDPTAGEIYAIYLDPPWWGRGAGRLLHDAVVARLDAEFPRSKLWVLRGNDRAGRFYRAAGWAPDGTEQTDSGPDGVPLVEERYVRTSLNPRWESTKPSRS